MFPLKKHQNPQASLESNTEPKPVLSVESVSLIDYAEGLKERFGVNVFRQQLDVGLETQQLDNSEREAMMDRIKSTINTYDNQHPHTGPTHIYLLDGRGLGNADDGVVNALIASSLRNPSQTLAALIPENTSYTQPDDLSPSSMLRQLADQVLASEGVRCVVGKRALEAFLNGDAQYVHVGKAAVEVTAEDTPPPRLSDLARVCSSMESHGSTDTLQDPELGLLHWKEAQHVWTKDVHFVWGDATIHRYMGFIPAKNLTARTITDGNRKGYKSWQENLAPLLHEGLDALRHFCEQHFPGKVHGKTMDIFTPGGLIIDISGNVLWMWHATFTEESLAIFLRTDGTFSTSTLDHYFDE